MSTGTPSRRWTGSLTGTTLTIVEDDHVTGLTVMVTSGTVNIKGNFQFPNTNANTGALASQPIPMASGAVFTDSSTGSQSGIDGFEIDATGGVCDIVLQF